MAEHKTLILVRHAKSSWKDKTLNDIKRPLNKRGNRDAPKMGQYMAKNKIQPEVIFSSPGLRALTTARLLSLKIDIKPTDIIINEKIYTFDSEDLLNVIKALKDKYEKVMIVAHNPAITDLVNYLSGSKIDNVPTCGVAVLKLPINSWKKVSKNKAKLDSFDYPKKLW
ncbi:MAG: histidine phosphatase family protein [Deltaproteobacteria bacterium]|nr:histidine phosphatase family protein [Deltaproteobacteria bacterium]